MEDSELYGHGMELRLMKGGHILHQLLELPIDQIPRVSINLLLNPGYISKYLEQSVLNRKSRRPPLDLELPWIPYAAIDFLHTYLTSDMNVCEYGCGGSTLFFAKRVKMVYSIEDNPKWFDRVSQRLKEKSISNVQLGLFLSNLEDPTNFEKSDYVRAIPNDEFDVIFVDGTETSSWQMRPTCFRYAESRVRSGGIIVIDDSGRYTTLNETNRAKSFNVFQSVKPCHLEVSSTDVYFY